MAGYDYGGWAPYVTVAERRLQAEKIVAKLAKKGKPVAPVRIEGRVIAASFWGKAWCRNLESYRDYENRLERGRGYVRNGSVVDLRIAPLEVTAMVSGSSLYTVRIGIAAASKAHWQTLCRDCAGGIDSLVELLQGRFSKAVMERICRQDTGLFPKPSEITFHCSCPDFASMCKHVAAALYGVGARLDQKPETLFLLRAVDGNDLIANLNTALPMTRKTPASGKILAEDDLSALFGLDMDGAASDPAVVAATVVKKTTIKAEQFHATRKASESPRPDDRKKAEPKQSVARKPKLPVSKRTANGAVKGKVGAKSGLR